MGLLVINLVLIQKRNLPYIEFPEWISDIIGDGLIVDYVVTQGEIGNVAAKELINIKKKNSIKSKWASY